MRVTVSQNERKVLMIKYILKILLEWMIYAEGAVRRARI